MEPEEEPSSPSQSSPEPRGLLYILFSAFGFLLGRSFSRSYSESNQEQIGAVSETSRRGQQPAQEIRIRAELTTPEDVERQRTANDNRNYSLQKWLVWGTWLAFIAASVYAGISLRIWLEMQKQTRIQRDTSINSERAWVGLDTPVTLDAIGIQANARVMIKGHYSMKNFGHGPAFKVIESGIFVDTADQKIADAEADDACEGVVKFTTGTVPVGGEEKPFPPFGRILFSNQPMDRAIEFAGPVKIVAHFRFVGCVAYIDQFRSTHWTRFCMERRPGDIAQVPKLDFCSLYNDTDQPKEK